LEQMLFLLFLS